MRKLLDEGHEVIALDNFWTSQAEGVNDLAANHMFRLIR